MIQSGISARKLSTNLEIEVFFEASFSLTFGRDGESGQKQRSPHLAELSYKIRGIEDGTLLHGRLSYGSTVIS
jgi:hypothetical protein